MKKFLITTFLSTICISLAAQNFAYKVGFDFFFDNLEGSEPYAPTRTFAAVKLLPEIGVRVGEHHQLMVGASLIQDLGDSKFLSEADYTIYYKYSSKNFNGIAGSFSRNESIAHYPLSFFREDYKFFDDNIEGLMLQYMNNKKSGFVELYADWYGQNQKLRIDEFLITGSTEYNFYDKLLIVGGSAMVNHYKNEYELVDAGLYERVFYNVYVASDLSKFVPFFNVARIGFGSNSSAEHLRYPDKSVPWESNIGWQVDLHLDWKGLALKNQFYFGEPQMIYYQTMGDEMYWGSQFYQAKRYNLTELSYKRSWKFLNVGAAIKFHFTPGMVANQQILTLGFNLHQMIKGGKAVNID